MLEKVWLSVSRNGLQKAVLSLLWKTSLQIGKSLAGDKKYKNAKINWQFTTEDARIKLKRLYPVCED